MDRKVSTDKIDMDNVQHWLDLFRTSWAALDVDASMTLFTPDYEYVPSPFRPPIVGQAATRAHLQRLFSVMRDVRLRTSLWGVNGRTALFHLQAQIETEGANTVAMVDSVTHLVFDGHTGQHLLVRRLAHWSRRLGV